MLIQIKIEADFRETESAARFLEALRPFMTSSAASAGAMNAPAMARAMNEARALPVHGQGNAQSGVGRAVDDAMPFLGSVVTNSGPAVNESAATVVSTSADESAAASVQPAGSETVEKRKRRTKAEMEALRAAQTIPTAPIAATEAPHPPKGTAPAMSQAATAPVALAATGAPVTLDALRNFWVSKLSPAKCTLPNKAKFISELLLSHGAASLSTLDPSKYGTVMAAFEAAYAAHAPA